MRSGKNAAYVTGSACHRAMVTPGHAACSAAETSSGDIAGHAPVVVGLTQPGWQTLGSPPLLEPNCEVETGRYGLAAFLRAMASDLARS